MGVARPLAARQGDLFALRQDNSEDDLACLIARLEGRLGAREVARVELVAEHRPERAFGWRPAAEPAKAAPDTLAPGRRPTRLLARPVALGEVQLARFTSMKGPERIETGFWDGAEARRDYWIAADAEARESWIFQELDSGRWFLHGLFD